MLKLAMIVLFYYPYFSAHCLPKPERHLAPMVLSPRLHPSLGDGGAFAASSDDASGIFINPAEAHSPKINLILPMAKIE